MSGLTILKSDDSIFIWSLPLGKPDTSVPLTNIDTDDRPRTFQSSQKGSTCIPSVLNFLRRRVGKNPPPELQKEREIEQKCSTFRKSITNFDFLLIKDFIAQILQGCQKDSNLKSVQEIDLQKVSGVLEPTINEPADKKLLSQALQILQEFCDQTKHTDIHSFLNSNCLPKFQQIYFAFYEALGFSPKKRHEETAKNKLLKHLGTKIDLISPDTRESYIQSMVSQFPSWENELKSSSCYHRYTLIAASEALGFKLAPWTPTESIEALQKCLQTKGPIILSGKFGACFYSVPPSKFPSVENHAIFGWKGSDPKKTVVGYGHIIVIVGAKKGGDKGGFVYYIDPNDASGPKLDEKGVLKEVVEQKYYMTSLQNLRDNAGDLYGQPISHYQKHAYSSPYGYTLYHPEYLKLNLKKQ
ncbi:MAG: hypothetical protein HYX67_02160 [Candidatus Melainabacteria bacterium]|nr:hypothetical protein [Candidatus Melainabacteria bacterium]